MLYDDLIGPQGTWLCHHGVKGQKWGVRHDKEKTGIRKTHKDLKFKTSKHSKNIISSSFNGMTISMFNDRNRDMQNKTIDKLLGNWDGIMKNAEQYANSYAENRWSKFPELFNNIKPASIWIGGDTPCIEFDNGYGILSVEMNPNTLKPIVAWYDD